MIVHHAMPIRVTGVVTAANAVKLEYNPLTYIAFGDAHP